jgi:hypothetical protein
MGDQPSNMVFAAERIKIEKARGIHGKGKKTQTPRQNRKIMRKIQKKCHTKSSTLWQLKEWTRTHHQTDKPRDKARKRLLLLRSPKSVTELCMNSLAVEAREKTVVILVSAVSPFKF